VAALTGPIMLRGDKTREIYGFRPEARAARGVQPKRRRNMRLKDEGSSNPQDEAMSAIVSALPGSARLANAFASRRSETKSSLARSV
jgi:hypothetical protein